MLLMYKIVILIVIITYYLTLNTILTTSKLLFNHVNLARVCFDHVISMYYLINII